MKKLFVFGGLGLAAYLMFGEKVRQLVQLTDINSFSITGIKNLKIKFPNLAFDVASEYINNSDQELPVENIVVKINKVLSDGTEEEIGTSRPNTGVKLKPRGVTRFSVPIQVGLSSIFKNALEAITKKGKNLLRIRYYITAYGQTIEDFKDVSL